jgi:uncharacterized membrane protein YcaP (DUF421 family)
MRTFNISLLEVALRTVIIYAVVLAGIRLTGKREVEKMATYELVLILLLANAVQNAMTGPDTSLTGGVVGRMHVVNCKCNRDPSLFSLAQIACSN